MPLSPPPSAAHPVPAFLAGGSTFTGSGSALWAPLSVPSHVLVQTLALKRDTVQVPLLYSKWLTSFNHIQVTAALEHPHKMGCSLWNGTVPIRHWLRKKGPMGQDDEKSNVPNTLQWDSELLINRTHFWPSSFTNCALGKLPNFSLLHFFSYKMGIVVPTRSLWGWKESVHEKRYVHACSSPQITSGSAFAETVIWPQDFPQGRTCILLLLLRSLVTSLLPLIPFPDHRTTPSLSLSQIRLIPPITSTAERQEYVTPKYATLIPSSWRQMRINRCRKMPSQSFL